MRKRLFASYVGNIHIFQLGVGHDQAMVSCIDRGYLNKNSHSNLL